MNHFDHHTSIHSQNSTIIRVQLTNFLCYIHFKKQVTVFLSIPKLYSYDLKIADLRDLKFNNLYQNFYSNGRVTVIRIANIIVVIYFFFYRKENIYIYQNMIKIETDDNRTNFLFHFQLHRVSFSLLSWHGNKSIHQIITKSQFIGKKLKKWFPRESTKGHNLFIHQPFQHHDVWSLEHLPEKLPEHAHIHC